MNVSITTLAAIALVLAGVAVAQRRYQLQRPLSVGFSVALIAISAFMLYSKHQFLASATKVQGTVIERYESDSPEKTAICFRVSFQDLQGHSHIIGTGMCSSDPSYTIGQAVVVAFPAAEPSKAIVVSESVVYFWPLALGTLGALLLGLEAYQAVKRRKDIEA